MRVLVTGASGFIGYAVSADLMDRGHDVIGLTRSKSENLFDGVEPLEADLLCDRQELAEALAGVDGVCHLAARSRVRESLTDPLGYWHTNMVGTLALLDAMHTAGTPRLVLASTCVVYADGASQPIPETAPLGPSSPYGASKLAADHAAAGVAATGAVGVVSLRAFAVAGAVHGRTDLDHTRLIPKMLAVQQGDATELVVNGDGDAIRDFVHVADMASAFTLALESCEPGKMQTYNIGSGKRSRVRDVIAMVESVTGRPVARRHAPAAPEPQELLADSGLIEKDLDWSPRRSELREIVSDAWSALNGS